MTSQQDALYRSVCEYPDEDMPRLIFADWVEEAGDSIRAEFIRMQIALARVAEHDVLWTRARQLHPNAILGWSLTYPLPSLPAGFSWEGHRTRRGFSWQATAENLDAFLTDAPALFAAAPVQSLCFDPRSNLNKRFLDLVNCPHLDRIRRLEFSLTRIDSEGASLLGSSPFARNITELSFANNAVTTEGLGALAASCLFEQLRELELERAALPPSELVESLAAMKMGTLRRLSVSECLLASTDVACLASLPFVQSLHMLDLSDNPLGCEGVQSLAESSLFSGLAILNLSRTHAGLTGIRGLAKARFANLRQLDLSSNRLGPMVVGVLAGSPLLWDLRSLNLSHNPLGDAGAQALASSAGAGSMHELILRDCGIGEAGAAALANSPHLSGLLRLDLRDCGMKPLGLETRSKLRARFGASVSV
jgi:uncharacterized protein (TIGR02996 family)